MTVAKSDAEAWREAAKHNENQCYALEEQIGELRKSVPEMNEHLNIMRTAIQEILDSEDMVFPFPPVCDNPIMRSWCAEHCALNSDGLTMDCVMEYGRSLLKGIDAPESPRKIPG